MSKSVNVIKTQPNTKNKQSDVKNKQSNEQPNMEKFGGLKNVIPDLFLSSMFINMLGLALPLALLQTYDRIIPNASRGTLLVLAIGVILALLLEASLRVLRSFVTGWIGARFEHRAGCAAFKHMMMTNLRDFEHVGTGVHLERISSLRRIKEFYSGQAITTLLDLPFTLLFLALIAILGGHLVWVPVSVMLLFLLFTMAKAKKLNKAINSHTSARCQKQNFSIEILQGMHSVKSMAMEEQMMRRFDRLQENTAKANYNVALGNAITMNLGVVFSQLTMVSVAAYGCTMVLDNQLTVGSLASCTLLAGRSLQPLQRAVGMWTRFQSIQLAKQHLKEIFAMCLERRPKAPVSADNISGKLEIRDICFRYSDNMENVLYHASLKIAPGECIGITGANGSGKSTLLNLIIGTLKPNSGSILIDDVALERYEPHSLKCGGISYLPPEGVLFQGTIMDNITMFRDEWLDKGIKMATFLGLDEVVTTLPLGYNTRVGNGTTEALPRGISQRITLARTLIAQPKIVLFDEANTAVDNTGDAYLRRSLKRLKGSCTVILVTSRPSLLRLVHKIFTVQNGTLVPQKRAPFSEKNQVTYDSASSSRPSDSVKGKETK